MRASTRPARAIHECDVDCPGHPECVYRVAGTQLERDGRLPHRFGPEPPRTRPEDQWCEHLDRTSASCPARANRSSSPVPTGHCRTFETSASHPSACTRAATSEVTGAASMRCASTSNASAAKDPREDRTVGASSASQRTSGMPARSRQREKAFVEPLLVDRQARNLPPSTDSRPLESACTSDADHDEADGWVHRHAPIITPATQSLSAMTAPRGARSGRAEKARSRSGARGVDPVHRLCRCLAAATHPRRQPQASTERACQRQHVDVDREIAQNFPMTTPPGIAQPDPGQQHQRPGNDKTENTEPP